MFTLQSGAPSLQLRPLLPSVSTHLTKRPFFPATKFDAYSPCKQCSHPPTRLRAKDLNTLTDMLNFDANDDGKEVDADGFPIPWRGIIDSETGEDGFPLPSKKSSEDGKVDEFDRDPEFADIIGTSLEDPDKARSKLEDRLRRKKNKILHTKTGSAEPVKVTFNSFEFTSSYIWFEFYNEPLEKDVTLLCDTLRAWHIVGRLGGCNSMNMQLSQSSMDKRPTYDAIQGANVSPATFYNIGDLELQDNLARIWVDIGTSEPLLLDILINALTQLSSDFVGIKQVMFGGLEFEGWKENLKTEETGYTVHKI